MTGVVIERSSGISPLKNWGKGVFVQMAISLRFGALAGHRRSIAGFGLMIWKETMRSDAAWSCHFNPRANLLVYLSGREEPPCPYRWMSAVFE